MSAVLLEAPAASSTQRAEALAAELRQRFEAYNAEFTRITRRAAEHFHSRNWQAARADAVQRIELYDRHVGAAIDGLRRELGGSIHERDLWVGIKRHFELQIAGVPDSDFYRTFLNSITRDVFGTVGVDEEIEFTVTASGRASGSVPIRVHPVEDSLQRAVNELLADLPFAGLITDVESFARQICRELTPHFDSRRQSAAPRLVEAIDAPFYRGDTATLVGRLIGDGSITPFVIVFRHAADGLKIDSVLLARKILSCVARVGQRFGAAHVTNVLRGSDSDQVTARRHDQLSTFGLLKDMSVPEVRGYIEQLSGAGLLRQTDSEFPVLELTEAGVTLLKDADSQPGLALARQKRPAKDRGPRRARGVEAESWQDVDRDLFEKLRGVRLEIARERGVPPYVIFHDTTLRDMARLRPMTIDALRHVRGVGERKAADLGERFLAVLREHE